MGRERGKSAPQTAAGAPAELPHPGDALPPGARVRLGTNRLNHVIQRGNTGVCLLAYSPCGRYLLGVGYEDNEATLWELPGGREVWRREVDCGSEPWATATFSPDSHLLAIGGCGGLRVFDTATGKAGQRLRTDGCGDLAFSPCGRYLLEGVSIWDVDGWEIVARLDGGGQAVTFSPDGRFLAGAGETLCVWEWPSRRAVNRWKAPDSINALCFLPGGRLASSAEDETVRVRDIASGRELSCYRWGTRGNNPFPVVFRPDGRALVLPTTTATAPTRVLDVETGVELQRFTHTQRSRDCICLAWSPDGRTLATAQDGRCHLWDTATGIDRSPLGRHFERPYTVVFSANGQRVLTTGDWTNRDAFVWDAATGRLIGTVPHVLVADPQSLTLSPDGARVAACHGQLNSTQDGESKGPHLYVWEIESGQLQEFPFDATPRIATWTTDGRGPILWDGKKYLVHPLGSARSTRTVHPPPKGVSLLSALADGRLVGRMRNQFCIWDIEGRIVARTVFPDPGRGLLGLKAVAPDGRFVAVERPNDIAVYRLQPVDAGAAPKRGRTHAPVAFPPFEIPEDFGHASSDGFGRSEALLADGRLLVAACRGSQEAGPPYLVKVWEAASGLEVWESPVFPCAISEVVFAPGGRTLAVALYDTTTVLFDIPVCPSALDPSWLTSTVVALARGIAEDKAFDRLPILADALQDAGCDNEDVLSHCRSGSHVCGRRVVGLVLGKE